MTTAVLVIAHNEERYIKKCISSLLDQTLKPDQIVLVVHNSTDNTLAIAQQFPITIIPYNGPKGITYARIEGLRHVQGDIILCIDGDSFAARNWVEEMSRTLQKGNILVGSWMKFKGTVFGWFANFYNKYRSVRQQKVERMIWGPSMAFWGKDKELVMRVFQKTFELSAHLGLTRNPDDYWLALYMRSRGNLALTNKTYVSQYTKEVSSQEAIVRSTENVADGDVMDAFLEKGGAILPE